MHIQADAPPVEMHVTRQLHSPGSGGERPAPRWSLMRADGTLLQPNRTNPPSAENSMKTDPKYKKRTLQLSIDGCGLCEYEVKYVPVK